MPDIDPVILQLRAEVRQYQNEIRATTTLVSNQLDRQERAVIDLEHQVNSSSNRIGAAFSSMGQRIAGFASGVALGAVITQMASLADQAKQLDAQLRLATNGFGTFAQGQEDVRRIADSTRGSLEATTKLYAGFLRASKETGRSQSDAARATTTFAEALKIGGASTEEAASATLQFNQALQSGVLRGDEFNSIMEASPRIARLLADALGVPIGQLRKMAEEGQITSDVLFRALTDRKFTAGIDAEFKQIPVTFGDAMQAMENAALTSFGEFDKGGRFSEALVSFLGTGTDTFEGLTSKAQQFGVDTRAVFDGFANLFDPLDANAKSVFDALGVRIYSVQEQISSMLHSIDNLRNVLPNIQNAANAFDRRLTGYQFGPDAPLSDLGGSFDRGTRRSQAQSRREIAARRLEGLGYTVPRNADGTINEAGIVRRPQAARPRPAAQQSDEQKANARALAKHTATLADLEKLKVGASQKDLALINRKIDREEKIVAALKKGVGLTAATTVAGGGGRGGKSDAEKEAAKAAKEYKDFIAELKKDLVSIRDPAIRVESDERQKSSHRFQDVFGREGQDYEDPFAGVGESDRQRGIAQEGLEDAERNAQIVREDNVRSLANLYEDLFTQGSARAWDNFKRDGLRTLAIVLAQATISSFTKGGGGFGSLLGNILNGAKSAFGGGSPFGRASGGYVAPGQTVRVNEQRAGVELLRMGPQGGTVIPLGQARTQQRSAATTVLQTIQVDARGAVMNDQFAAQILTRAGQDARQVVQATNDAARKGLPAAQRRFGQLGTTG